MNNSQFVIGIFCVIILAKLAPHIGNGGGILKPEITVKYIAVSIIFLNSGLTLPSEDLADAILQWDLHLFVQGFTFIVFPAIVFVLIAMLAYTSLHSALLEGMTILSTMPPPVSSAIILTKAVGGNEAAAVFNSALGSILGIVITPTLILLFMGGEKVEVPTEKIFQQLFLTVVVPLVIGQLVRNYKYQWLQRQKIPFKTIGQCLILFIIYSTFCSTFSRTDFHLDITELIAVVFIIFLLQILIMTLLIVISSSSNLQYTSNDSITIMYCGTHKSLTLGIPMIEIIFEGSANLSYLSIPLLVYNPMQIVMGGFSIGIMQSWLRNMKVKRRKLPFSWQHV